jgi:hypothetical protein
MFEEIILEQFSFEIPEEELNTLLNESEKYYIAKAKLEGHDLTNSTDGGDGLLHPSDETRQKIKDARSYQTIEEHSPEVIEQMRAAQKIRWANQEQRDIQRDHQLKSWTENREYRLDAVRLRWQDPETVKKHKERFQDPELRERIGQKAKEMWDTPGFREKHAAAMNFPATRELRAQNSISQWEDPIKRKKNQEAMLKAKHSDMSVDANIRRCKDRICAWKYVLKTEPSKREKALENLKMHEQRLKEFLAQKASL